MKFNKDKQEEIISILGEGIEMVGEISFTHGLRIDGVLKGKIRSESRLVIGPKGKVEAEVVIRRISINGEFRGTIRASDRVEVHKEGRVYGDLYTPCLIIEAGALFEGKCNMSEQAPVVSGATTQAETGRTAAGDTSSSGTAGKEKSWSM